MAAPATGNSNSKPIDSDFALSMQSPREAIEDVSAWLVSHWLNITLSVGAAILIYFALNLVRRSGRKLAANSTTAVAIVAGRALARTSHIFLALAAVRLVIGYAGPPDWLRDTVSILFTVVATFQVAVWLREIVLGLIERNGDPAHETLSSAMGIIRLLVTVALFAVAAIVVLDNLGVNVTGLVAGLGIGGIAIGLAAQGIFSDLFAALSIIFDKPFRQGETIAYDGQTGTVERIGLKTTRLRAITGERKVISNTQLLNKDLTNYAGLERRRIKFAIGVIYQTSPDVAQELPDVLKMIVTDAGGTFVRSGFVGFGASSLDFEVEFDVFAPDWDHVYQVRHRVGIAILRTFNTRGIEFAYPTQTTFTAAPDGTMVMPYASELSVKPTDSLS